MEIYKKKHLRRISYQRIFSCIFQQVGTRYKTPPPPPYRIKTKLKNNFINIKCNFLLQFLKNKKNKDQLHQHEIQFLLLLFFLKLPTRYVCSIKPEKLLRPS
jgi:hypothetical protein